MGGELVVVAVASVASVISLLLGNFLGRRKSKAEADLFSVQAAEHVVTLYGKALEDLQAKVEKLESANTVLQSAYEKLQRDYTELRAENAELRMQLSRYTNGFRD